MVRDLTDKILKFVESLDSYAVYDDDQIAKALERAANEYRV